MNKLRILLACALVVAALSGCAQRGGFGAPEPPIVTLANLVPVGATPFEARVRATLRFQNPNDFALDFEGMRFALEVNEQDFLNGVSDEAVALPRLGEATVSVEATTTTLSLWRQIRGLAADPEGGIRYTLSGRLFSGEAFWRGVDFERTGKIEGFGGSP
jgi:LEA14-like dessication related protein